MMEKRHPLSLGIKSVLIFFIIAVAGTIAGTSLFEIMGIYTQLSTFISASLSLSLGLTFVLWKIERKLYTKKQLYFFIAISLLVSALVTFYIVFGNMNGLFEG
ncbi:hypothetical protein [Bacillus fonticola]|uniref:hypothetical protein n=1 Tax=Bacillus fonticola TaxID=2728853 RepID=UPI0014746362|nr:hypothetical protein [Bacillus fonticola]